MKANFFKISVKEIIKETEDCVSISFGIPDEYKKSFDYRSGQYLTLKTYIENKE